MMGITKKQFPFPRLFSDERERLVGVGQPGRRVEETRSVGSRLPHPAHPACPDNTLALHRGEAGGRRIEPFARHSGPPAPPLHLMGLMRRHVRQPRPRQKIKCTGKIAYNLTILQQDLYHHPVRKARPRPYPRHLPPVKNRDQTHLNIQVALISVNRKRGKPAPFSSSMSTGVA